MLRITINNRKLRNIRNAVKLPVKIEIIRNFILIQHNSRRPEILQEIKEFPLKLHFKHVRQLYIEVANQIFMQKQKTRDKTFKNLAKILLKIFLVEFFGAFRGGLLCAQHRSCLL